MNHDRNLIGNSAILRRRGHVFLLCEMVLLEDRIEIVLIVGDGYKTEREAVAIFNERHPDRPVSKTAVHKLISKFKETGSVADAKRSGRPKTATNEDNQINTLAVFQRSPIKSPMKAAAEVGISRTSLRRILKEHKYHPYKLQIVHGLDEEDEAVRLDFCQWGVEAIENGILDPSDICFSDEAIFSLNGHVNRHNCRYYSNENPHWRQDVHFQHDERVMVWCGIFCDSVIGPFFFDGTVTGQSYLTMLQNYICPAVVHFANEGLDDADVWFMQDGAPPHYATIVRNFLDERYPDHWIGRRGPVEWPPRSPDLNPLDYFLWGFLKSEVYRNRPRNINDLTTNIRAACQLITPEMIQNVQGSWQMRLRHCIAAEGRQFEDLI